MWCKCVCTQRGGGIFFLNNNLCTKSMVKSIDLLIFVLYVIEGERQNGGPMNKKGKHCARIVQIKNINII